MTTEPSPAATTPRGRPALPAWALPVLVAVLCASASARFPLVSALLLAIGVGVLLANTVDRGPRAERLLRDSGVAAKHLLRAGIVLLGLRLAVDEVVTIGWQGVVVVLATVATTYGATLWLGRRLGLDRALSTLVAAGFAICGAAAIATVAEQVRARQRDVALALALVTAYGTVMIAAVPWLAGVIGLDERAAAVWAGASIHEVAQVVAAASLLGPGALALATTVKLARVVMLAPVAALVGRGAGAAGAEQPDGRRPAPPSDRRPARWRVPWFVTGFLLAVVVRSTGLVPSAVLDVAHQASTLLLAAGMFGLGLAIHVRELWPVPPRLLALGGAATAIAAGVPLVLLLVLPA